jgi:hypothetical protein
MTHFRKKNRNGDQQDGAGLLVEFGSFLQA